jgi:hypothetical protein
VLCRRLLKINYVRHLVIRDLLESWNLDEEAQLLLVDSRDLMFQANPFACEWPDLWTGEEDRYIRECTLNSFWLKRVGDAQALRQAKDQRIVCAGVIGGTVRGVRRYLERSSLVVKRAASRVALDDGDQGIHNYLVRTVPELNCKVLSNGSSLIANLGYTRPEHMALEDARVRLSDREQFPAILHQYDRHPALVELATSRWAQPHRRDDPCKS